MLVCQVMAQDIRMEIMTDSAALARSSTVQSSGPTTDPQPDNVSSLRALALSTLRSKRKKETSGVPVHIKPLPVRPAAPDNSSILLDYGSEIKEDRNESVAPASSTSSKTFSAGKPATPQISEDGEVKEEGEISDEEPRASSIASSSSPLDANKNTIEYARRKMPVTQKPDFLSSAAMSINGQKLPSSHHVEQRSRQSFVANPDGDIWNSWVPSDDHIRPGLKMNMEQFNLAKELILDLLGWGVAPEYLIDCGLTREAVFYTFMELNLRLPKNLDVSGLLPSSRETVAAAIGSQTAEQVSKEGRTVSSNLPSRPETSPIVTSNILMSHPLPAKPATSGVSSTSSALPGTPVALTQTNSQDLSDIEAKKRQELLARKAVLASRRKNKARDSAGDSPAPPISSATSGTILDTPIVDEPSPLAPTSAVDDFLKNMMETAAASSSSITTAPTAKARTLSGGVSLGVPPYVTAAPSPSAPKRSPTTSAFPDGMTVDSDSTTRAGSSQHRSGSRALESPVVLNSGTGEISDSGASRSFPASTIVPQDTRRASAGHTPPSAQQLESRSGSIPASPVRVSSVNGRRGTKRPVAMDFVDVDHNPNTNLMDTTSSAPPPFIRRKLRGFAGLGAHVTRKCVIDLSDSEDDGCGESEERQTSSKSQVANQGTSRTSLTSTSFPRPPSTRPLSSIGMTSSKPSTPTLPPEALAEKERQIRQMREMIARREQERLRKLAKKSETPAVTPPSAVIQADSTSRLAETAMKIEQVDFLSTTISAATSSTAQPSCFESNTSNDQADEDMVMQTLEIPASTSDSAASTPTDIKTIALEHSTSGEPGAWAGAFAAKDLRYSSPSVLTEEAKEEPGGELNGASGAEKTMPVDVARADALSAQVESHQGNTSLYSPYTSPFSSYPLLRSRSRVVADLTSETRVSASSSVASAPSSSTSSRVIASKVSIADLRPLRVSVVSRGGGDVGRRICQFEVPGGGECRDKTCTDLHLGDLEPDDHEVARYLLESMPDVLQAYNESEIADQLVQARQKTTGHGKTSTQGTLASLEDRVAEAVTALVGSG